MQIKITYPTTKIHNRFWKAFCNVVTIIFVVALFVCPTINLIVGGKAWSVVVVFSCYLFWSTFISPSLFDLNATSQFIKFMLSTMILLILIDLLLKGGWGIVSIPIVGFGGLIVASGLFYGDFEHQKHHFGSYFLFILIGLVAGIVGICVKEVEIKWMYIVTLSISVACLVCLVATLGKIFIVDMKKKLHTR